MYVIRGKEDQVLLRRTKKKFNVAERRNGLKTKKKESDKEPTSCRTERGEEEERTYQLAHPTKRGVGYPLCSPGRNREGTKRHTAKKKKKGNGGQNSESNQETDRWIAGSGGKGEKKGGFVQFGGAKREEGGGKYRPTK